MKESQMTLPAICLVQTLFQAQASCCGDLLGTWWISEGGGWYCNQSELECSFLAVSLVRGIFDSILIPHLQSATGSEVVITHHCCPGTWLLRWPLPRTCWMRRCFRWWFGPCFGPPSLHHLFSAMCWTATSRPGGCRLKGRSLGACHSNSGRPRAWRINRRTVPSSSGPSRPGVGVERLRPRRHRFRRGLSSCWNKQQWKMRTLRFHSRFSLENLEQQLPTCIRGF